MTNQSYSTKSRKATIFVALAVILAGVIFWHGRGQPVQAQVTYEVACPAGSSPLPFGQSVNPQTGLYRAFACIDSSGNVTLQPETINGRTQVLQGGNPIAVPLKVENANQTAVTVQNTVAETDVMTFTLPANELAAGQVVRILAYGVADNQSAGTPNYTLRLKIDANVLIATPATVIAATTVAGWKLQGTIGMVTAGAAGTSEQHGDYIFNAATGVDATNVTVALDTTVAHTIKVTTTMSSALTTIRTRQRQFLIERVN